MKPMMTQETDFLEIYLDFHKRTRTRNTLDSYKTLNMELPVSECRLEEPNPNITYIHIPYSTS